MGARTYMVYILLCKKGPKAHSRPQSFSRIAKNNVNQTGGNFSLICLVFGGKFHFFSKQRLKLLSGDLKMASFFSDMEEIDRIVIETPDSSDGS